MPRALKLSSLVVVFVLGLALAWSLGAAGQTADTTTSDTTVAVDTTLAAETTTESSETTTEADETTTEAPASDGLTTTVQITTTRVIPIPTGGITTSSSTSDDETAAWVWVLLAVLAVALVALIVLLARRGHGSVPVEERRRHLDAAVASWTAQGWAIESDTADSTLLRRDGEAMLVTVDTAGHVSTRPLPPPAP